MKQLIIMALLSATYPAFAQKGYTDQQLLDIYSSLPKVDNQYEYVEVVQMDSSYKKDQLYKNAKLFFTDEFKSAKDVIQYDDRGEGKVIGKGNFRAETASSVMLTPISQRWTIHFTLEIYVKDGKYKYRLYGFEIDEVYTGGGAVTPSQKTLDQGWEETQKGMTRKMAKDLFGQMVAGFHSTIDDLKKAMLKKDTAADF